VRSISKSTSLVSFEAGGAGLTGRKGENKMVKVGLWLQHLNAEGTALVWSCYGMVEETPAPKPPPKATAYCPVCGGPREWANGDYKRHQADDGTLCCSCECAAAHDGDPDVRYLLSYVDGEPPYKRKEES
jgi:hypothetical protein